jgi:Ni/Co efflux regulator RcnB
MANTVTSAFSLSSDAVRDADRRTEGAILRKTGEMKRLIPIFAALTVLAGPLALGGEAWAKDGGQRGERGGDRGGERGGERGRDHGDRGNQRDRGGDERRGGGDGQYRNRGGPPPGWREGRGDYERGDRRGYEPEDRGYAPSPRRGGYMPPQAGGAIPDYGRYRLRPPPRGFVWVRTGNGYAMVSQETGRVYDVVPN